MSHVSRAASRLAAALLLAAVVPAVASAVDCQDWNRMNGDQQTAQIEKMIDGHVYSDYGTKFTSENRSGMKRCLLEFVGRIRDDFDETCMESASRDALDDVFDQYFLSCVQ